MRKIILGGTVAACFLVQCLAQFDDCRFAPKYTMNQLLSSDVVREEFLMKVVKREVNFAKNVGIDKTSGLTLDGQQLDVTTGLPFGDPHWFSAPSKESIHLALLALAVANNEYAQQIYTTDEAIALLKLKMDTYEQFMKDYPGYGGFLPWYQVKDGKVSPSWDWTDRVPSLDNGQIWWACYAVVAILEDWQPSEKDLIQRYTNYYQTMAKSAYPIFYEGNGYIRTVSNIKDTKLPVDQNTYSNNNTGCSDPGAVCYLDDPYEGELFAFMMYFFSDWPSQDERNLMWTVKKAKLQSVNYYVPNFDANITVQRGWWFSAHEQWKYLFLPYQYNQLNNQLFLNAEKVRTWDSKLKGYPGMYASVNGNITKNTDGMYYVSGCGVQEVAFERVSQKYLVTPYSTMTLFLADKNVATAWYHNMIKGPAGQNQFGSTEGMSVFGDSVSPMVTWDAKMTTMLGLCGGVYNQIAKKMQRDGLLQNFLDIVQREWSAVFTNIQGADLPYALPDVSIPSGKGRMDFTSCKLQPSEFL